MEDMNSKKNSTDSSWAPLILEFNRGTQCWRHGDNALARSYFTISVENIFLKFFYKQAEREVKN